MSTTYYVNWKSFSFNLNGRVAPGWYYSFVWKPYFGQEKVRECQGSLCLNSWMNPDHWTFLHELSMVVHHHDPECHVKRLGSYLQGQSPEGDPVRLAGLYMPSINKPPWSRSQCRVKSSKNNFLPYLLNFWWTFCNQIKFWYSSTLSCVIVFLWQFLIAVLKVLRKYIICHDKNYLQNTYPFLRGILVYHHELECHANSLDSNL